MYSISEVAKKVDLKPHTIRYYEKEGIIEPIRDANGVRLFDDTLIKWLMFIKKLRETQMPISQLKEYTRLFKEGAHTTSDRLELLLSHQNEIRNQIETLRATDEMLDKKIAAYKKYIGVSVE